MPHFKLGPHNTFKHPCKRLFSDSFDWFFDHWPDGKVVFLTRDPFARIWSHIDQRNKRSGHSVGWSKDRKAFREIAKTFTQDYVATAALEHSKRILKVNYEDLVTKPEATLRRICRYLKIDFSTSLLQPTRMGLEDGTRTNRTGSNEINANSLDKWKSNLTRTERTIININIVRARARKIYRPAKYRIDTSCVRCNR